MPTKFDPNAPAVIGRLFGLPYSIEESELMIVPVPSDLTTSSSKGTANGPQAVLDASGQVDIYDIDYKNFRQKGIAMQDIPTHIVDKESEMKAKRVVDAISQGKEPHQEDIDAVNTASEQINNYVYTQTKQLLDQ